MALKRCVFKLDLQSSCESIRRRLSGSSFRSEVSTYTSSGSSRSADNRSSKIPTHMRSLTMFTFIGSDCIKKYLYIDCVFMILGTA